MNRQDLSSYQKEVLARRKAELEAAQAEMDAYLESEQYLKDQWDANEERWAKKAAREGWHYEPKPFVSALQRQQAEEQATRQEIAYLKEKLEKLENK
ncbi:MAG: hypothetical protein K5764_01615 [Prevotella sp.]|nr:hypothetical protein [Prevotella sp.]